MDKLLEYFIKKPQKEFHVRELAGLIKKSPTTVSKQLKRLEKENILSSNKKLNHLFFRADLESQSFKDRKFFYNISRIRKSKLIDYLVEEFNNPEAIILFGSYAKAEDIEISDIDIMIITPVKKEINLAKYEDFLEHKIHIFLNSNKEIDELKIKNKELLNSFVNGIVINGFWEIFK